MHLQSTSPQSSHNHRTADAAAAAAAARPASARTHRRARAPLVYFRGLMRNTARNFPRGAALASRPLLREPELWLHTDTRLAASMQAQNIPFYPHIPHTSFFCPVHSPLAGPSQPERSPVRTCGHSSMVSVISPSPRVPPQPSFCIALSIRRRISAPHQHSGSPTPPLTTPPSPPRISPHRRRLLATLTTASTDRPAPPTHDPQPRLHDRAAGAEELRSGTRHRAEAASGRCRPPGRRPQRAGWQATERRPQRRAGWPSLRGQAAGAPHGPLEPPSQSHPRGRPRDTLLSEMAPLFSRREGAVPDASSVSRASSRMSSRIVCGTPRCDTTDRKLEFHILLDNGSDPVAKLALAPPEAARTPRHRGTA